MYGIPGLRRFACSRLRTLFNLNPYLEWTDAMSVWEIAYHDSREGDSIRQMLTENISVNLFREMSSSLRRNPGLQGFLERCPELASDLLWISIERDAGKYERMYFRKK